MPAVNPQGGQQYWFDGASFEGVQKSASPPDGGTQQYWFDGQAYVPLFGAGGGGGGGGTTFPALTLAP